MFLNICLGLIEKRDLVGAFLMRRVLMTLEKTFAWMGKCLHYELVLTCFIFCYVITAQLL